MSGRVGAHQARPARRRRIRLQFERLEDRLVMDGDSTLVADAADEDHIADAVPTNTAANDAPALPVEELSERFQSTAEFEAWLIEAATAQWGHLFGQTQYNYSYFLKYSDDTDLGQPIVMRSNSLTNNALLDSGMMSLGGAASSTNVQVAGVDEADLVETDGEYLYILSGNELVIVEAGIGDDLRVLSRFEIGGDVVGMYLDGDRLAIVSSGFAYNQFSGEEFSAFRSFGNSYANLTTTVTVLDVSDRSAPELVQKSEMDGRLVASRVVDGELRLVLTHELQLPPPIAKPLEGGATVSPASRDLRLAVDPLASRMMIATDVMTGLWNPMLDSESVYETLEEYVARVKDEIFSSATPSWRELGLEGAVIAELPLVEATNIYRPGALQDRSMTTIATFDLSSDDAGPVDTKSVFTREAAQVYATSDSIYVFSQYWSPSESYEVRTAIHKFDFAAETHEISLAARGDVKGILLNQFAADEHEGFLRVVTQNANWNGSDQSVFVLEQIGKRLEVVGSVEGIAPAEQVYSVRFMGDRVFLVTFRVVDPLFALDLSDPTDPKLMGELKVPGFSDYLQPIDENHLLAIGRGADEANGLFEELQVSIFNIADLENPQLVHRYSFEGGRAITTSATGDRWRRGDGDHLAVSYFAASGVFALPIFNTGESAWWDGTWNSGVEVSGLEVGEGGLQVFQIDVTTGFTPIGIIEHETAIQRSVQIGEHLYAISDGQVSVHELTDPTVELGTLSIASAVQEPIADPPIWLDPIFVTMPWWPIAPLGGIELQFPTESELPFETSLPMEEESEIDPGFGNISITTITTPIEVPSTDPIRTLVIPTVEAAATEVVAEPMVATVAAEATQVAIRFVPQVGVRTAAPQRVQRLARFDAFESFDNLLLTVRSMDELADRPTIAGDSLTDEAMGDDGDASPWDALCGALAADSLEAELAI